jgi:signal recognition particle GTPase
MNETTDMLTNQLFKELQLKKSEREEDLEAWKLEKKKRVVERRSYRVRKSLSKASKAIRNAMNDLHFPEFNDVHSVVINELIPKILSAETLVLKTANDIIGSINNNELMTKDRLESFDDRDSIESGDDSFCDSCNGCCWRDT